MLPALRCVKKMIGCIDADQIKKAMKPNTKCVIINFPHNPTGQVITQDELDVLVALCAAHDVWLFADEVYRLLGNPQHRGQNQQRICIQRRYHLG